MRVSWAVGAGYRGGRGVGCGDGEPQWLGAVSLCDTQGEMGSHTTHDLIVRQTIFSPLTVLTLRTTYALSPTNQ